MQQSDYHVRREGDSSFLGPLGSRGKDRPATASLELIEALVLSIERLLRAGGFRFEPQGTQSDLIGPADVLRCRLSSCSYEELVPLLKELLAIPMAVVLDSDLPPESTVKLSVLFEWKGRDRFLFLFPAVWGRFIKLKLFRSGEREAIWWAAGILALKKGLPDLRGSLVEEALSKHEGALTSETGCVPVAFNLLDKIRMVTEALFPPGTCPTTWENLVMATSATTATPRQGGGARAEIFQLGARIPVLDSELEDRVQGPLGGFVAVRGDPGYRNPARVPFRSGPRGPKGLSPAVDVVRAAVVSDPLKSRVVTLTHVERGMLKPFQQALHKRLRHLPPFVLTGEWVRADHLDSRFGKRVSEGALLNSGDFSAATDNVPSEISRAILGVMMRSTYPASDKDRGCYHRFFSEGMNSLTENVIQYGDLQKQQKRGQLMGSLLSFPVLCVFNFCVWAIAHYEAQYASRGQSWKSFLRRLSKRHFLQTLPVLINGDDILSCCDLMEYGSWSRLVKEVGWTLSVGKSYLHSQVAVINSQVFRWKKEGFEHVLVFNNGLLGPVGQGRSSAWLGEQPPVDSVGELATQFLRGSKVPLESAKDFVRAHRKVLSRTKRPLFLSKRLGGLGGKFPKLGDFERWEQPGWVPRYARTCRKEKFSFSSSSKVVRDAERFVRAGLENLVGTPLERGVTPDPVVERCLRSLRGTLGRRTVPFGVWRSSGDDKVVNRIRLRSGRGTLPLSPQSMHDTPNDGYHLNRMSGGVRFAKTQTGLTYLPLAGQAVRHRAGGLRGSQHIRFSEGGEPTSLSVTRFGMTADLPYPTGGDQHLNLTPLARIHSGRPPCGRGGAHRQVKFVRQSGT